MFIKHHTVSRCWSYLAVIKAQQAHLNLLGQLLTLYFEGYSCSSDMEMANHQQLSIAVPTDSYIMFGFH